jgi:hypothetical protein
MELVRSVLDPGGYEFLVMVELVLQDEFSSVLQPFDGALDGAVFGFGLASAEANHQRKQSGRENAELHDTLKNYCTNLPQKPE